MGGGDGEPVAQRSMRRLCRRPHRQHRRAGTDDAGVGASLDPGGAAAQAAHRRGLADLHPARPQPLAEPERQAGGLHRRRAGIEDAGAESRRGAASVGLGGREHLDRVDGAKLAAGRHALLPDMVLSRRGGDLEVAGSAEPGVDALSFAELPDLNDRSLSGPGHSQRRPIPPTLPHARERKPHRVDEPTVSPTRPPPTPVRLQQHHPSLRLERFHMPGSPHPGEPPTDHHHISFPIPSQRWCRLNRPSLLQPVPMSRVVHEDECAMREWVCLPGHSSSPKGCVRGGIPTPAPLPHLLDSSYRNLRRNRRPATGDRVLRVRRTRVHRRRLRTADHDRPAARRRPRGNRRGRHLRRGRPRRPAGCRPARRPGRQPSLRRVLRPTR